MEIGLPAGQVFPQFFRDFVQAATARPARHMPDALPEGLYCLGSYSSLYFTSGCYPEMIAEKLTTINACYCCFGFIHLQMKSIVEFPQPQQYSFARFPAAYIHIIIVSIAHKPVATSLHFPVNFVQQHIGQERREWATLRCTLIPLCYHSVNHDSCFKISTYQP